MILVYIKKELKKWILSKSIPGIHKNRNPRERWEYLEAFLAAFQNELSIEGILWISHLLLKNIASEVINDRASLYVSFGIACLYGEFNQFKIFLR